MHSGLEATKVQTEPEEWTGDGAFRFLSGAALNGGGFFGGNFGAGNGTVPGGNTSQQNEVVGVEGFKTHPPSLGQGATCWVGSILGSWA